MLGVLGWWVDLACRCGHRLLACTLSIAPDNLLILHLCYVSSFQLLGHVKQATALEGQLLLV